MKRLGELVLFGIEGTKVTKEETKPMLAEKTLQEVMMGKPVNRMK